MVRAENSHTSRDALDPRALRAELFGGRGGGLTIRLEKLDDQIAVFQNGGAPFSVPPGSEPEHGAGTSFLGIYELVGPLGPETPVYVSRS
jgi:hypothetical protein